MKDVTGQRFGRLTAQWPAGRRQRDKRHIEIVWLCLCDCGKLLLVPTDKLSSRNTQSCGCLKSVLVSRRSFKHGHSNNAGDKSASPEYTAWQNMKDRCYDPTNRQWKDWGGRGITVCDRWRDSFENFFSDMGRKPEGLMLERINNDGNYEPSNCKWATRSEQMKNRRPWKKRRIR